MSNLIILSGHRFDNPAAAAPAPARHLTFNYLLPVNTWLLLCPTYLCCDWTMGTIALIESVIDVRNLATLMFYIILAAMIVYAFRQHGQRTFELIMVCMIPVVSHFYPVPNRSGDGVLFSIDFFVCIFVCFFVSKITRKQLDRFA